MVGGVKRDLGYDKGVKEKDSLGGDSVPSGVFREQNRVSFIIVIIVMIMEEIIPDPSAAK